MARKLAALAALALVLTGSASAAYAGSRWSAEPVKAEAGVAWKFTL